VKYCAVDSEVEKVSRDCRAGLGAVVGALHELKAREVGDQVQRQSRALALLGREG
jgi:hypothetical protein